MKRGIIIRNIENRALARITHWDHVWVNRSTGAVWDSAFIVEYLTGDKAGQRYVEQVPDWEQHWERVYMAKFPLEAM